MPFTFPPRYKSKLSDDASLMMNFLFPDGKLAESKDAPAEELEKSADEIAKIINETAERFFTEVEAMGETRQTVRERAENMNVFKDQLDHIGAQFKKGIFG